MINKAMKCPYFNPDCPKCGKSEEYVTPLSLLESLEKDGENMSYVGVLDSNERRRGYDIARQEFLSLIKQYKENLK